MKYLKTYVLLGISKAGYRHDTFGSTIEAMPSGGEPFSKTGRANRSRKQIRTPQVSSNEKLKMSPVLSKDSRVNLSGEIQVLIRYL